MLPNPANTRLQNFVATLLKHGNTPDNLNLGVLASFNKWTSTDELPGRVSPSAKWGAQVARGSRRRCPRSRQSRGDRRMIRMLGVPRHSVGAGYSAEPEPCFTVSAVPASIPNAFSPDQLLEEARAIPLVREAVLAPNLCPTCGAPVSGRLMVVHIQALVAAYYSIPFREMTSARRHKGVAQPRQVAMYLAAELTPKSLPDIGQRFGGRDHTTVIHAIKRTQQRMLEDPEIEADVKALRERLAA
jgi:hypothetical protein